MSQRNENTETAGGPKDATPAPKRNTSMGVTQAGQEKELPSSSPAATEEALVVLSPSSGEEPSRDAPEEKAPAADDEDLVIQAEAKALLARSTADVRGTKQQLVTNVQLWNQAVGDKKEFTDKIWNLVKNAFSTDRDKTPLTYEGPLTGRLSKETSKRDLRVKCCALWQVLCTELQKVRQETAVKPLKNVPSHGQSFSVQKNPNTPGAYDPTDEALRKILATDVTGTPSRAGAEPERAKARYILTCRAETQQMFLHLLTTDDRYADQHVRAHIISLLNNAGDQKAKNLGRPGAGRISAYAVMESLAKRAPEGDAAFRAIRAAVSAPRAHNSSFPSHARALVDRYIKVNTAQFRNWGCDKDGQFIDKQGIKVPVDSEKRGLTAYVCICHIQTYTTTEEKQQFDRVLRKVMETAGITERPQMTWNVLLQLVHHLEAKDGTRGARPDENWPDWSAAHTRILKRAAAEHKAAANAVDASIRRRTAEEPEVFLSTNERQEIPGWAIKWRLPYKFQAAAADMGKTKVKELIQTQLEQFRSQRKGDAPRDAQCGFCLSFGNTARAHRLVQCRNLEKIQHMLTGDTSSRGRHRGRGAWSQADRAGRRERGQRREARPRYRGRSPDRSERDRRHRQERRGREPRSGENTLSDDERPAARNEHPMSGADSDSEQTLSDATWADASSRDHRRDRRDVRDTRRQNGDGKRRRGEHGPRRKQRKTSHGQGRSSDDQPVNSYAAAAAKQREGNRLEELLT